MIQYCTSEAREVIKNYCILEWEQGYKKARHIWHHQFRRPHLVRQVQVNQLTKGQSITPAIGAVLQKIASQMLKCELTLAQMGCDADWNNPETFLGIKQNGPRTLILFSRLEDVLVSLISPPLFNSAPTLRTTYLVST